jgi:hypothetical protein
MSKATSARGGWQVPVSAVRASPYRIPADAPEGDGTFEWNATTLVVVELDAGGQTGIGYTYSDSSIVAFIANTLSQCVTGEEIGSQPHKDPARVKAARDAIGDAGLFVDANGAFSPREALYYARQFEVQQVAWFEEPVSSDDAAGLRFVREHAPFGMDIAAGEYGYTSDDFRRLLAERSVDVLQADVSRCGGITGFCRPPRSAMRFMCRCPRIARPHCICMWLAPCRDCAIRSGFMTTCASRQCCSTAHRERMTVQWRPT